MALESGLHAPVMVETKMEENKRHWGYGTGALFDALAAIDSGKGAAT